MTLKQAIQNINGLKYIIDKTDVLSPIGRRYLYAETWSSEGDVLIEKFKLIEQTTHYMAKVGKKGLGDIEHLLCQTKDIEGTIDALMNGSLLTDIEFFEIKTFALTASKIKDGIEVMPVIELPSLEQVIRILDPERTRTAAFYIYNAYDERLVPLRAQLQKEENLEIYLQTAAIEDEVRKNIAFELRPLASTMRKALQAIAQLDILIAKCKLNEVLNLCKPSITEDKTAYTGLFNPAIQMSLKAKNKAYQAVNIEYGNYPTLITGINMGGKTVLLKTLALAQTLCQFGFFVPAASADISLVERIMLSIEDAQSELSGLSSFASEMVKINEIISTSRENKNILVLIDELARTTNPTEGRAIVEAMIEVLTKYNVRGFVTSHYDGIGVRCRRLRVKGLKEINEIINIKLIDQLIDYSLVEDNSSTVPHEALNIARIIGVDEDFINRANERIEVTDERDERA